MSRLIDADGLIKTLSKYAGFTEKIDLIAFIKEIDNAPTVEYPFYQEAYQTGYEEGKNERPQGEWINAHEGDLYSTTVYKCSKCGRKVKIEYPDNISDYPFCHCGADMRGKEE